jgi:hypothetical protein
LLLLPLLLLLLLLLLAGGASLLTRSLILLPNPHPLQQVSKGPASVSFNDLWGLWLIAGAGAAVGGLIMLAQRAARRLRKQQELEAAARRPLPLERRSHAPLVRAATRLLTRGGPGRGAGRDASPARHKDADLEDLSLDGSRKLEAGQAPPPDADLEAGAGAEAGAATPLSQPQLSPPGAAPGQGGRKRRESALLRVESIFKERSWKSEPRADAAPP